MNLKRDIELKRILVTGASGLLGLNFCNFHYRKFEILGISNKTRLADPPFRVITRDLLSESPDDLLDDYKPDTVLHCAAMANLEQCEKFPEEAAEVNGILPGRLASAAHQRGIKFVHISTDAVFDGEDCGESGYREDDKPNPLSRYAETKLIGERNVLDSDPDALVARVNFYGWSMSGKRSLAEFFCNNLSDGKPMNVFRDVYFNSLYVRLLADLLVEMVLKDAKGIYHVFSSETMSKYDFGVSIAEKFGYDPGLIRPVSWKDGGLTARRSPNLIMNTDKLRSLLGHDLPGREKSLDWFYEDSVTGLRQQILGYQCPQTAQV